MSTEYVYPKDVLPEMGYDDPHKRKNCSNCHNSIVTNPGANIPGLRCRVMEKLFKEKKIKNGNGQVSKIYGSCRFHNMTWKRIKKELTQATGA